MKTELVTLLWRYKILVVVGILAVAVVGWLTLWPAIQDRKHFFMDCKVKGADGEYHLGACPPE